MAKAGRDGELNAALAALARTLYRLAVIASPFLPGKALELWQSLGLPPDGLGTAWASLVAPPVAGLATKKPEVLFPKPPPV